MNNRYKFGLIENLLEAQMVAGAADNNVVSPPTTYAKCAAVVLNRALSDTITQRDELLDHLDVIFSAYEDGPECYEDPVERGAYIGKALLIDEEQFKRLVCILNEHRPRPAIAKAKGE